MSRASRTQFRQKVANFRDLVFGKWLLIFQMPKTGSQTVEASLQNTRFEHRIIRCHYLSSGREEKFRRTILEHADAPEWSAFAREQVDQMLTLRWAIRLRRWVGLFGFRVPKLEIITGVREPLAVALSALFENHAIFAPSPELLTPERCREVLLSNGMVSSVEDWFDLELKPLTGIDIYQRPFPRRKGYAIYETGFVRLLVYRIEALGHLGQMLREFLGCEIPEIISRNEAETKHYSASYRRAKDEMSLPVEFVDARYAHKFARQFYTVRELSVFCDQWTRGESTRAELGERDEVSAAGNCVRQASLG